MSLRTWTGAVSSVWSNTANWQNGLIPTNGDSITTVTSPAHVLNIDQPSMTFNNVFGNVNSILAGTFTGHVDITGWIQGGHFNTAHATSAFSDDASIVFTGLAHIEGWANKCDFQGGLILGVSYSETDNFTPQVAFSSIHGFFEARGGVVLDSICGGQLNLQFFDCTLLVTGRLCLAKTDEQSFFFNGNCVVELASPDAQFCSVNVSVPVHRADELRGITTQIPAFPARENLT